MVARDTLLTASKKANSVIDELCLKSRIRQDGYTRIDPSQVASFVDVPVMYKKLDKLLGGFIRESNIAGILVNADRPRGLVHMTCAHELGHYFLGHGSTADEKVDHEASAELSERLADQFAYSLLAPRWLIASTMRTRGWTVGDLLNPVIVYQLSLRLGISYTAMVWSLQRTGVIRTHQALILHKSTPKSLKQLSLRGEILEDSMCDVWVIGPADKDCILEPGYGDKFIVELPNHAGSGHLWSIDELGSDGFELQPFVADATKHPRPSSDKVQVGGTVKMNYVLIPPDQYRTKDGPNQDSDSIFRPKCDVGLVEKTPWDSSKLAIESFKFGAEFESTSDGLTASEKQRRINQVIRSQ